MAEAPRERGRTPRRIIELRLLLAHYGLYALTNVVLLTINALTAADSTLIPIQCEYFALEGLGQLLATIRLVPDHLNPRLEVKGAVLTMYDGRTRLSSEVGDEVRRHLGDRVYDTVIPRNIRLAEAPSYGMPISSYAPESSGAIAYSGLTTEFLERDRRRRSMRESLETGVAS